MEEMAGVTDSGGLSDDEMKRWIDKKRWTMIKTLGYIWI